MITTKQKNVNIEYVSKKANNPLSSAKTIRMILLTVMLVSAVAYLINDRVKLTSEQGMEQYIQASCNRYILAEPSELFNNQQDFVNKCYHHLTNTMPTTAMLSSGAGFYTEMPFVFINWAYNAFNGINRGVRDHWLIFSKEQCNCWYYNHHLKSSSHDVE